MIPQRKAYGSFKHIRPWSFSLTQEIRRKEKEGRLKPSSNLGARGWEKDGAKP